MAPTKEQRAQYSRTYYVKNRDRLLAQKAVYSKRYRRENPKAWAATKRRHSLSARAKVLDHYGRACACCGETTEQFLTLDHKNNDGAEHRRKIGKRGSEFYRWVIHNDFPDHLQLLCWNCNCAKGHYGKCPHEDE